MCNRRWSVTTAKVWNVSKTPALNQEPDENHQKRTSDQQLILSRTHSLRRTKVQLLLGHSKIKSTVRYLGIEVDDAIEIAEKIDI